MKILCISASNTAAKRKDSASVKVCGIIEKIIREKKVDAIVDIVPLAECEIGFCRLCGDCAANGKCNYDDAFNELFFKINDADMFFFVVPHYSPIPSKLLAVFEKINEVVYARWMMDSSYAPSFANKPVGIIGHGGMTQNEKVLKYYHDMLVTPVANTLKSLSFNVIGLDEESNNGTTFGLMSDDCIAKSESGIFPAIIQNYDEIENRIRPYIENVVKA